MSIAKEIKQAITYGQWVKEGKITKEENALLMKELLKKGRDDCQP
jgi:polyhydroxyalkanoate synthesis regulator phasin